MRSIVENKRVLFFPYELFPTKSIENWIHLIRNFNFDFADNELVHEMDLGSNKRKKVSNSSMIKSKKVNIGAEIVSKSSNIGR